MSFIHIIIRPCRDRCDETKRIVDLNRHFSFRHAVLQMLFSPPGAKERSAALPFRALASRQVAVSGLDIAFQ